LKTIAKIVDGYLKLPTRSARIEPTRPFTIAAPVTTEANMTKSNSQIAPSDEGFSLISRQKLLTLYTSMLRCRSIVEQLGSRSKNGHSVLGHEAAAVGAAIDLLPHDTVVAAFWPDAALKAINPSVSIAPRISGASQSAFWDKNTGGITVLFSDGQRSSHSSWLKALHLAAGQGVPSVFVSISRPDSLEGITGPEIPPMKRNGRMLPLIAVDGNDVVAVYRVASEAIAHARKGNGPTLIDCRLSIPGDPLKSMKKYLLDKGLEPAKL
jgi:TPP-dependent pyruvate/acetoin dehydrogenase alpha subunit